jgi:uncharacterized protein YhfF
MTADKIEVCQCGKALTPEDKLLHLIFYGVKPYLCSACNGKKHGPKCTICSEDTCILIDGEPRCAKHMDYIDND